MEEGWPREFCTVEGRQEERRRCWRIQTADTQANPQQWFRATATAAQRGETHMIKWVILGTSELGRPATTTDLDEYSFRISKLN